MYNDPAYLQEDKTCNIGGSNVEPLLTFAYSWRDSNVPFCFNLHNLNRLYSKVLVTLI